MSEHISNLLIGTGKTANSDAYFVTKYKITEPLVAGTTYTISAYVEELECEGKTPRLYVFDNAIVWNNYGFLKGDIPGLQTLTFTPNTQQIQGSNPNYISFYNTIPYSDAKRKAVLHHVMLVKGTEPAAWAPAEGETLIVRAMSEMTATDIKNGTNWKGADGISIASVTIQD